MTDTDVFHSPGQGPHGDHRALRRALPLAAIGTTPPARRGRGQRGPSPLPFILPLALFGLSRIAMRGQGGRRGPGPFGGRPPFTPGGEPPFHPDEPGFRPDGPGFGPGHPLRDFLSGGPFGRARRARRGDVRAGILALLKEEPRNGYQIIQELGQRSGGAWRPSPGSVYPALQQLEDEGLIHAEERDGKRTFRLTEAGVAYAETHREEVAAPWDAMAAGIDHGAHEVGGMIQQVAMAAMQVVQTGNTAQLAAARNVLAATRRSLYRILAEDEPTEGGDTPEQL